MSGKEISLETLAEMVNGEVAGDGTKMLRGVAPFDAAQNDHISFLAKSSNTDCLETTIAGAVIVHKSVEKNCSVPLMKVRDPYLAVAIIHSFFLSTPFEAKGVHPRAHVGDDCRLGQDITVGPLAVLGDRVHIGERVTVESGAVIGDDVEIGDDSMIMANVTVYRECVIGKRVTIHAGTVIGSDGYGYAANEQGQHIKRPQVGIVRIDDDVEIGANCCVDRATFGVTWIKSGAKIDNLVQIAHNVVVGENSLLVSQVGISGSTTLGRNVVMGGQVGITGHISIGDRAMVAARGGVHTNLPQGAMVGGTPALPVRQWARCSAVFAKLPELQKKVRKNTRAIDELSKTPKIE
ncbi:MAG: UDP-3-O-(3-hydroxymyristoyl)glucosamine N-acyltransferase [Desulforhopalus sp.]